MQNLVTLELNSFRFGAAGLSRLRGKRMPRLRSLALSSCALGDADAAHLASLGLPSLRRLDLCYNELTDGAVSALAGAPWISALTRLKLSENEGVGDAGAAALAAAPLRGLRALRIGGEGTRLTDAGVAALAGAAWLTGLTELKLSACYDRADYLGSDRRAWAALAAAPLNALRVLGLKFVRLQPDAAAALGAAPWLQGLRSLTVERGSFLAIVEAAPHSCRGLLKRAGVTFSVAYNMALPVPSEDEGSSRPSDDAGDEGREALADNEGSAAGDGFNCRSDGGGCGGGDDEGNGEAED
ncbi:hypothetical protein MNEG_10309 [Monoraphidium neglectum]|jgi:hypothetical protein|uniref:Uncharacterized protein n=1 Tax=Monoraphidium neglectum TaxID=145388 RepID=A0A0D2M9K9_9CHLO|nr:hypothetical protein MNEG_10309 [Monoraphidium neglectum]KIY97651.1 hypothetical protein MNEG_10309 [Monoraphidium neglectum]|eukprot:XP_013896671.1 hypothetical protein MNEG_10309 [Monoraphidium neglectum]